MSEAHLFVHVGVLRYFSVDGWSEERGEGHGLHGDELDLVGKSPACLRGAGHAVDVLEDGRSGGQLLCTPHGWGACCKKSKRERDRDRETEREKS